MRRITTRKLIRVSTAYFVAVIAALMTYSGVSAKTPDSLTLQAQFPRVAHPAYSFYDRFETQGEIRLLSRTRPLLGFNRHQIHADHQSSPSSEFSRYWNEGMASRILLNDSTTVYPTQSGWLPVRRLLRKHLGIGEWFYGTGYYLASWQYGNMFSATLQPVYGLELIRTDDERGSISRFTSGARIEGGYGGKVRFMMDFRDHTEAGNGPYFRRDQLYEDRWASVDFKGGSSTSYDISESFIQYYGRDLSIAAGRGIHRWGPGQFGSLFLNSNNPPFDYVRFDAVLENGEKPHAVYYTFLHGFLQSALPAETLYVNPGGRARTLNAQKFLSAQRIEVRARDNLLLGLSQAVVYGDRGLQLGYLTPLNFLYSVQHANDDKDNFVLGLDGTWRIVRGLKLYGEAFFDDIVVGDLTKSTGNNKSAYTVGMQGIVPKPFWSKFGLSVEYTKIRPFVYSHIFETNTYAHWFSPLGYTREPNSEFLTAEIRGTFYPLQVTLQATRQNHGENPDSLTNVGGDIYSPLSMSGNSEYPFLAGHPVHTTTFRLSVEYELVENLRVFAAAMKIEKTNKPSRLETHMGFGWNL